MFIGSKAMVNKATDQTLLMSGVEQVKVFKYLGLWPKNMLWLDKHLTFEYHVSKIYNDVCQRLGAIRKVRNCLGQSLAITAYRSLVFPHYDHCSTIYMSASKDVLQRLQLVPNVGCRIILQAKKRTSVKDMHHELSLET